MSYIRLFFLVVSISSLGAQTPVEQHGPLKVRGRFVVGKEDKPVQLRGMSFFWHQWEESHKYWNSETIDWLAKDWKIDIVRLPVGIHETGWFEDSVLIEKAVRRGIEAAIASGLYVMVDWHSHNIHLDEAKGFFSRIAQEYGAYPNLIYEVFNEPDGHSVDSLDESWPEIKEYSQAVIAAIRKHDSDNIIIVGTPFWSQMVDTAADDRIRESDGTPALNVVYTLHFYAAHHQEELMARANYALSKNLPLWVTECGRTGVDYGPDNSIDPVYWHLWEEWMDSNHISWNKWSLSRKNEKSSSLKPSASFYGGWTTEDLTPEGIWNRQHFRELKKEVTQ